MTQYLVKVVISAVLVVLISELAKRSTWAGALVASLPIVSLLAMLWLYADTKDAAQVATLSRGIFWLVLPSLVLFVALPMLIERGLHFYTSLALATVATILAYGTTVALLRYVGIRS